MTVDVRSTGEADGAGDVDLYEAFVIGSTVEAGHWLSAATGFVQRHEALLAARPVWLFSSGPLGDRRDWPAIEAWAHEIVRDLVPPTA